MTMTPAEIQRLKEETRAAIEELRVDIAEREERHAADPVRFAAGADRPRVVPTLIHKTTDNSRLRRNGSAPDLQGDVPDGLPPPFTDEQTDIIATCLAHDRTAVRRQMKALRREVDRLHGEVAEVMKLLSSGTNTSVELLGDARKRLAGRAS
jgi:hypothetical protein